MRIAIVGVGAVGGYFGGRLAASGADVTFIARGRTLEALRARGLRIESPLGDLVLPQVTASDAATSAGGFDAAIVAVKAWQVPEAGRALRPLLAPGGVALPLENGVEAPEQLAAALGEDAVIGGSCRISAYQTAPAYIVHAGIEPAIALGELDDRPSPRVERLQQALCAGGVRATIPPSIRAVLWEKLLFIAAVSGVGAVARAPIGELRSRWETRELLVAAMREVAEVAAAGGVPLAGDIIERTLAFLDAMPAGTTASMQRDIMEGRPSELEAINGAVVRLGRERGVRAPVNDFIYAALLPQEAAARRDGILGG